MNGKSMCTAFMNEKVNYPNAPCVPEYMATSVWTRFSKWQGFSTETALVEVGNESTLLWQLVSCPSSQWGTWDNSIHTACRSKFQLADILFDFSLPDEADRGPQGTGRIAVTVLSAGWSHSETKGCTTIMLKVSILSAAVVSSHYAQSYLSTFGPLQEEKLCAVQWLWLPQFSFCTRLTEPGLSTVPTWPLQPLEVSFASKLPHNFCCHSHLCRDNFACLDVCKVFVHMEYTFSSRGINNFMKISHYLYSPNSCELTYVRYSTLVCEIKGSL